MNDNFSGPDTGFDYHVDVEVPERGVRPTRTVINAAKTNLAGIEARDRVKLRPVSYKWIRYDDKWWFIIGANKK